MDYAKESLRLHGEWKGKIEVVTRVPVENKDDLSLAYTPGVAQPCLEIQKDVDKSYDLTRRWNMCLVVTDGSAVLGLGNIGPEAGMPVMEGKCVLFKAFGDVDAFPLCIKSNDVDEIVNTIYLISGSFGGVNLEDISAPRCFEIEKKLKEKCDIPIFHDDQHGTAIITLAGLTNALKVVGKKKENVRIVMNGAGAAAISIARLLLTAGFKDITLCDRKGAIYEGRPEGMNPVKDEMAKVTNLAKKSGSLADMLVGADVFIGASVCCAFSLSGEAFASRIFWKSSKISSAPLRSTFPTAPIFENSSSSPASVNWEKRVSSSSGYSTFVISKTRDSEDNGIASTISGLSLTSNPNS